MPDFAEVHARGMEPKIVPLSVARIVPELREVIAAILAETDIEVYATGGSSSRTNWMDTWVIIARDGNVGTVEYDRLSQYKVKFCIEPSRKDGSGAFVWEAGSGNNHQTSPEQVVRAALVATERTHVSPLHEGALTNHGWDHFNWTRYSLEHIVAG